MVGDRHVNKSFPIIYSETTANTLVFPHQEVNYLLIIPTYVYEQLSCFDLCGYPVIRFPFIFIN